jgi:hypothetical protein
LELEAQAEVDKYVAARANRPDRGREWLARLFDRALTSAGLDPHEAERYREASRLASAFCADLEKLPHGEPLLARLRAFWRRSGPQRLEEMRRLAA